MINFPVSLKKTVWAVDKIVFLGLLIDAVNKIICIPIEKLDKAMIAINKIVNTKMTTVLEIQKLDMAYSISFVMQLSREEHS